MMFGKKINIAVGAIALGIVATCGADPGQGGGTDQSGSAGRVIDRYGKASAGSHVWHLVVRSYSTKKDNDFAVTLSQYSSCDVGAEWPTCGSK